MINDVVILPVIGAYYKHNIKKTISYNKQEILLVKM